MGDYGTTALADIFIAWKVVAASAVIALILGYLFLFVIRAIGGLIIYVFLILIFLGTLVGGFYVKEYAATRDENDTHNKWLEYGAFAIWGLAGL